ncbi:hypothetical protein SAMN04487928_1343 [Butyrivibrio proteoclasticus]|uniref:Uncharacterized protein n=1 Tax=Butyrivibrio proteoclasticus TaxID=43305 RepID=A0A1I5XKP2_9FIRM|nr:hypothetical protein [Butyrivibrio proteoclasticus]SFQ32480.1 hypothetical protein SAMN04487928_1343 [Butyrivibrio proteoclasticus]
MHESTNINYGEGTVTIIANSDSLTEIAAPIIRAGDYNEIVTSCLTKKEMNEVFEGESAEIVFYYTMLDAAPSEAVKEQFYEIKNSDSNLSRYTEGFFMNVSAQKSIGSETEIDIYTLNNEVELQIEIPLFLRKAGRSYACIVNNMGVCKVLTDVDVDAETFSISTDCTGNYMLLYKDSSFTAEEQQILHKPAQYLFIIGIIALLGLWFILDKIHSQK